MKRYQEKHVKIWEEGTWVVCPECQNSAIITPDGHLVHCYHCGYEKKSEDLQSYTAVIKLNCPNCGTAIHNEQHGMKNKMDEVLIKCQNCSFPLSIKPHYEETYNKINPNKDGLKCDYIFGLPYFFQENVRENLFWARNTLHMKLIEDYVSSDLRERKGMSLVAKLPSFIKSKKNRDAILKIIQRWKNLINENPSS